MDGRTPVDGMHLMSNQVPVPAQWVQETGCCYQEKRPPEARMDCMLPICAIFKNANIVYAIPGYDSLIINHF